MKGLARTTTGVGLVAILAFLGCRPGAEEPAEPEPLVTEDIGAPVDAAVTTEYDVQARSMEESVGSGLPDGFPGDVPLCSSNVVNHGPAGPGREFVTLSVAAAPEAVASRCDRQIESGGWRRAGDGAFERGGRRILVTYRQGAPGTWVRIEYPAGG
jgi:hypothetical protein